MPAGRPKKEIDRAEFESLLAIQCSLSEVTAFFDHKLGGCSEDTIERWCEREYKQKFAEIAPIKREYGKIGLRRAAYALAQKNAAVCIFLCKNWLGMKDSVEYEDKESLARLDAILDGMKGNAVKPETE